MATPEPGLDRHEWASEMEALKPDLEDSPAEALPELDRLIERMLTARGFAVDDPVADDGVEPEVLVQFRAARETTRMLDSSDDVGPGDIAAAVNGYRAIYEYLVAERSAP